MSASRYNLRARTASSTASPTKADFQVAQILMSLRSWASAAPQAPQVAPVAPRQQPSRACRDTSKTQKQSWPTGTIAERVKAHHAGQSVY